MRKSSMLFLLLGIAGIAIIGLADGTPGEKPAANPEVGELRNEIRDLRAKVQTLEDRMKGLESTVTQLKQPHLTPLITPAPDSPLLNLPVLESKPPKIWGEKEINGWTFYVVPCEQKTP